MLADFIAKVVNFSSLSHAMKIKHFVWYLQSIARKEQVRVADVRACYDTAHLDPPANLARSMEALTEKKPPDLLRRNDGYRLHADCLAAMNAKYGKAESTIAVESALAELPSKLTKGSERAFLEETLTCYRHGAFRATIVMAWNLAYDHLLHWILADSERLLQFNRNISKRNSKKSYLTITARSDFEELKEDEAIDIAASFSEITGSMKRSLKEKLGRRNTYAHPSTMTIAKPQVDEMITDLVNNVVLKLR